ncbi:MAG: EamA family transporter [Acidobacteriia bacterium]|nr:EamA family transporter [Terriglobia bacterium]
MNNTPFSSMAWVMGASFFGSFGALFLKIGAGKIQRSIASLLTNWRLMLGISFYLFSSVLFVFGVRQGELSVLYPMVSLGSVWTLIWSRIVLGEPFTRAKFVALGMILCGMTLIGLGAR